ncbi:MFS transporter [Novosphingobium fluoreni]|uniref:MFS transporter n=1 Tax=Novosphingobium fluoreni TaxID=1391222 RepID=UPI003DA16E0C
MEGPATPNSSSPDVRSDRLAAQLPARLDRLPWSRFHWLVVVALGITWILDGLEVTLAGSIAGALRSEQSLGLSASQVGLANSAYLAGAVLGALVFGWLTDRMGRKRMFSVTLGLYLVATAGSAFAWDLSSFAVLRFLTGAGIGGEYSAINSAIQELIPARRRGWTDLAINGSYWVGAAMAAGLSLVLLDTGHFGVDLGWRLTFFAGAVIGCVIIWLRRFIPESPRWLAIHGRVAEADEVVSGIEQRIIAEGLALTPVPDTRVVVTTRHATPLSEVFRALVKTYPQRTIYGLSLMIAQAFFYNAIFFTYAMTLTDFYAVPSAAVGWYILPFAAGNVLGPLILGRFFDTVGRRPMIVLTYAASGVLLLLTGFAFHAGLLDATTQTLCWSVTFFFASAAASASYLTVAESFPLEIRALAIAIFYALGTGIGGVAAPWFFGLLIESGSRDQVMLGYAFGAALMIGAAIVAWVIGLDNEGKPLEEVARPLSWN